MSSDKQIEADRRNAKKSTGPRTARGTAASSRNARKHGLTNIGVHNPAFASQIEAFARAIYPDTNNPRLWQQALIIGECTTVLRCVRAHRVALIEHLLRGEPESTCDEGVPKLEGVECGSMVAGRRDGFEAMCPGSKGGLDRLERYERRALSRRKRAIETFIAIQNDTAPLELGSGG